MSDETVRILVVDDEPQILRFLRTTLSANGFEVIEAKTGEEALQRMASDAPEIVVLDLGLPDMDGKDVIRNLREWSDVPIIVLSARAREAEKIEALDLGADDYVSKPFGIGELLARMRVALRHAAHGVEREDGSPCTVGDLQVDPAHRRVMVAGNEIHLTPIEFRLLAMLAKHAGKVLTQRQLLTEVWGPTYADQAHYLRVYMAQLRRKLEADPTRPKYLLTEAGVGYRLVGE